MLNKLKQTMKFIKSLFSQESPKNWSSFEKFSAITVLVGLFFGAVSLIQSLDIGEDPREKLAKQGIQWSYDNFTTAIASNDTSALELFSKGGMRLKNIHFQSYILSHFTPEVGEIFKRHNVVNSSACSTNLDDMRFYSRVSLDSFKLSYVKKICSSEKFKVNLINLREVEVKKYHQALDKNRYRLARVKECVVDLSDSTLHKYYDDASKFVITSKSTYTPREEVLGKLNIELLMGSEKLNNPEQLLNDSINQVCNRLNPELSVSEHAIKKIDEVMDMFI